METDFDDQINNEKYYYFIFISQVPIWTIYITNIILNNTLSEAITESDNFNYYLPMRIFEPCNSCQSLQPQVWRSFSYSLLHLDFYHLLMNSIALLIYSYLNFFYKSKYILFIYVNSIFIASLSFIFFNPYNVLVGCSGGVYGLIGASLSHQIINGLSFKWDVNVAFGVLNAIPAFILISYYTMSSSRQIAYVSHLYGYLSGLFSGIMVLKRFQIRDCHSCLEFIGFSGYLILMSIFGYGYYSLPYLNKSRFKDECCYQDSI